MARAFPLALLCLLVSCGASTSEAPSTQTPPPPRRTPDEVRRALREAMIQPSGCFLQNVDYAVRDEDFLDQVLYELLGRRTVEEVAADPQEVDRLIRSAPATYFRLLQTNDGLERLTRVINERFAHPTITLTPDLVRADYGHVAARMTADRRQGIGIRFSDSPHLDQDWQWRTPEVARIMSDLLDQHLDKAGVEVRVLIPGAILSAHWIYSYKRRNDRIMIELPDEVEFRGRYKLYTTAAINHDFGPYVRGEKSLTVKDLTPVKLTGSGRP